MTPEQLREACEMAGLIVSDIATGHGWKVRPYSNNFVWRYNDPALPAYVAELLVAKVRERMKDKTPVQRRRIGAMLNDWWWMTTLEQRITATMKVLTGTTAHKAPRE